MKRIETISLLSFTSLSLLTACHQDEKTEHTNVILIYTDDLGWAQSSPYGSDYYHTPNLDRLADNWKMAFVKREIWAVKWKLIEWFENSLLQTGEPAYELYNLDKDIGETDNLFEQEQGIAWQLVDELKRWRMEVDAQMPVKNPHYPN